MKQNTFENRLQNDLFPEMPASFARGLKQAMAQAGIEHAQTKRRDGAHLLAGTISLLAAAACLVIVLFGVLGGGRSQKNAAAPGEATDNPAATEAPYEMARSTPGRGAWKGSTKVIPLSAGFEFKNREKLEALHKGILSFLMTKGEAEPDELWLCAIKSRFVSEDTGNRADGYLSGYYVLAQHSFDGKDGPELYCLTDEGEVIWATEGSPRGPNYAIPPQDSGKTSDIQSYFVYGAEPFFDEPGIPHVKRGTLVGAEPGTDVEFGMAASITEVQEALAAADSAYIGLAKEFFLVTVPASSWDNVMIAHTLRFEMEEGNVDVNMETELPLAKVILAPQPHGDGPQPTAGPGAAVETTKILDLTGRTCLTGEPDYADLILRALEAKGEGAPRELWLCAVDPFSQNEESNHSRGLILAQYSFEGATGPELFYYEDGRIRYMTSPLYEPEGINVLVDEERHLTILFGVSQAYDGRPVAMSSGTVTMADGEIRTFGPVLPLDRVQQLVGEGPNQDHAREFYLCSLPEGGQATEVSIQANEKVYRLTRQVIALAEPVPAMAVESGGVVYPGMTTYFAYSLDENGVAADGTPLAETLQNGLLFKGKYDWLRPLTILTASDTVSVDGVDVYRVVSGDNARGEQEQMERLYNNAELSVIDSLPPGEYYLCFRTTVLGPYSQKIGRYTFQTDFTIYKVNLE